MKGLLIFFGILVALRYGARLVLPWLMKYFAKKVSKKMAAEMNQRQNQGYEEEGDVLIKRPQNNKKSTKDFDGGEYIDFEEVEK